MKSLVRSKYANLASMRQASEEDGVGCPIKKGFSEGLG